MVCPLKAGLQAVEFFKIHLFEYIQKLVALTFQMAKTTHPENTDVNPLATAMTTASFKKVVR